MKAVIQRVSHASVSVDKHTIASVQQGLLILLGITNTDTEEDAEHIVKKICSLRIFADENDKTNLSIKDVNGSLLIVSQFTLYADCRKGNRPSFTNAGKPEFAKKQYEYFIELCKKEVSDVQHGAFGEHMQITLVNDGPFTILLE